MTDCKIRDCPQGEHGTSVDGICRKAGIGQATYFNWKMEYAGMMPSEMKRLRELEEENGHLKRIVADPSPDKGMLQDVIKQKPMARSDVGTSAGQRR